MGAGKVKKRKENYPRRTLIASEVERSLSSSLSISLIRSTQPALIFQTM
jgi:hypothetical protein